jgi:hypothetical protein
MAQTKTEVHVRVLYPMAFTAVGVDTKGADDVKVEKDKAEWLVASGYAELVEKAEPKTEPKKKAG